MKYKKTYNLTFILIFLSSCLWSQDHVHFTQYNWIPSFQNPALSGRIEDGNMAYGLLYRDQAFTVTDNEYKSFAAHVDSRFALSKLKDLGLSLSIVSDKAGDGALNSTLIALGSSIDFSLSKKDNQFLLFGIQAQYIQRKYGDLGAFILEEELVNGTNSEPLFNQTSSYPDLHAGIAYKNNINSESSLTGGISIHHLNHNIGVDKENVIDKYDLKYNLFLEYRRKISNKIWLEPKIQHIQSNIFKATQLQVVFEYKPHTKSDYILLAGLGWRVQDAIEFLLGVKYKSWQIGFAYDYNTSGLRDASGSVVGLELGIRYTHFRPEKKETPVPEIVPVPEEVTMDSIVLIMKLTEIVPADSVIIRIEKGSDPKFDSIPPLFPYEYKLDPTVPYTFIINVPEFFPDTIHLIPGEYDSQPIIERTFNIIPKEAKDITVEEEPIVIVPDTAEERIIYIEEAIVLDKIYYDFDDVKILPESEEEMQPLLEIMLAYPDMIIELSSHTDVRGDDDYNIDLSQRRATSAKNWLVKRGIAQDRIIDKGYGETRLSNHCANGVYCSETLHRKNRRTEFKIISGPKSVRYRISEKK